MHVDVLGTAGVIPYVLGALAMLYGVVATRLFLAKYRMTRPATTRGVVVMMMVVMVSTGACFYLLGWAQTATQAYAVAWVWQSVAGLNVFVAALAMTMAVMWSVFRKADDPDYYRVTSTSLLLAWSLALIAELLCFGDVAARLAMLAHGRHVGSALPTVGQLVLVVASLLFAWIAVLRRPGKRRHFPWWVYALWMGASAPVPLAPLPDIYGALYEHHLRHRPVV